MRSRLRDNAFAIALSSVAVLAVASLALKQWQWTDYDAEARPAFDALVAGHVLQFFRLSPPYGGSLLLRAPFVLLTKLWGGGQLAIFRAAAVPCLVAGAGLGVWLAAHTRAANRTRLAGTLVVLLCVANPITFTALWYGHAEELLGAVLCVGAVLAAIGNRPIWAGLLLGLAVANKDWGLLAVGPVLIALPDRRPRALLAAAAVAATVLAPFALAGSQDFVGQAGAATKTGALFNPWQLWWFLGSHSHPVLNLNGTIRVGYRVPPGWVESVAHPLIVAISVPLTLLCVWLRRLRTRRPAYEPLLLLMLLLFLRFALDPWDTAYYALPFLITLVSWETLTQDRLPVLALAGPVAVWFVLEESTRPSLHFSPDMQAVIFLVLAVPALVAMVAALYAPGLTERLALRVRRSSALPSPA